MLNYINEWEKKVSVNEPFWTLATKRISRRTELKREFESLLDKEG
jgi:hypothetical protein